MDCDDNTETTHQYQLLLPQEILEEEIFYRLPVKSLLRFRCLSKSWRSLIDSSHFIKNHYHRNSTTLAHHRVIFDWERGDTKQCSLQSMLDQPRIHPSPSDQDTDHKQYIPTTLYASIVGCCNGLFCLINVFNTYILWNPATKTFFNLPQVVNPTSTWLWTKWGFGWDETTSAYKVFALSYYPIMVARVYSSKTNSWKSVNHGSYSVRNKVGLCVCKNLHWLTRGSIGSHIEAFDLKSDSFGKMELPWEGAAYGSRLGEVRGCLGVLRELEDKRGGADLWVMKEHGVKESWQILMTISPRDYGRGQRCLAGPLLPSGDMLLISGENFTVVCGGMVKHKKIITGRGRWRSSVNAFFTSCYEEFIESLYVSSYNTYVYVESLVSPVPFIEAYNPHY